jgi:hypothetical protein
MTRKLSKDFLILYLHFSSVTLTRKGGCKLYVRTLEHEFCIGGCDVTISAGVPFLFFSGSSWYALGAGGSALRWK